MRPRGYTKPKKINNSRVIGSYTVKTIYKCGDAEVNRVESKNGIIIPIMVPRTDYTKHDHLICENCQANYQILLKELIEIYNGSEKKKPFPNCCSYHAQLETSPNFKREIFDEVPKMITDKVFYTYDHLINVIDTENWLIKVSDFIEVIEDSFGEMPSNCGEPLFRSHYYSYLKSLINVSTTINNEFKETILAILKQFEHPKYTTEFEFENLIETYSRWLSFFPFNIKEYFDSHLKFKLESTLPIFSGQPVKNLYSDTYKIKLRSTANLIDYLNELTNSLLSEFNSIRLLDEGQISTAESIDLKLYGEKRRLRLKQGYLNSSKEKYEVIIERWLTEEEKFIKKYFKKVKNKGFFKNNTTNANNNEVQIENNIINIRKLKGFISYSKFDGEECNQKDGVNYLNEFKEHLSPLTYYGEMLSTWDDTLLLAGENWDPRIVEELKRCDIIFLLVSASFLSTKYIKEKELKIAIERHNKEECIVIPIIIKDCGWEEIDFLSNLNALPRKGHSIVSWSKDNRYASKDEAWKAVFDGVKSIIKNKNVSFRNK